MSHSYDHHMLKYNSFEISVRFLQGVTLATFLFMITRDYPIRFAAKDEKIIRFNITEATIVRLKLPSESETFHL